MVTEEGVTLTEGALLTVTDATFDFTLIPTLSVTLT